ncbi:MAG: hypothetical protein U0T03_03225 [Xanthomonadales bacterium]|nr:hypothetical protein [Xanthomonadales bacterium]
MIVITVDQCGDLLASFVGNRSSAKEAKSMAKMIGYNDSPLFGARKKRAALVSELAMLYAALVIFSANQVFNQITAKAVIESFLDRAKKKVFTHIEKEVSNFSSTYSKRMSEYFPIFHQDRAPLGLSFALMQNLGIDPLNNFQGQLVLTGHIASKVDDTIKILQGLTVIGQPSPPDEAGQGKWQGADIDKKVNVTINAMEQFMAQTDEWPEQIKIKALSIATLVLDGKGAEAKAMLVTLPRQYGLVVIDYIKELRAQLR